MSPLLLDSVVLIVILLSALFAFFRGFVKELLTIVNLGGAAAAAYFFGPDARPFFDGQFDVQAYQDAPEKMKGSFEIWGLIPPDIMSAFCAYASVFFFVFIILTMAGFYISGAIKAMGLGPVDRILGLLFGAVRGALLVFLAYLPFGYFMSPEKYPDWAKESYSLPVLHSAYEYGQEYMAEDGKGEDLRERVKDAAEDVTDDVRDGARDLKDEAGDAYRDAKDGARDTYQDMKEETRDILTDEERNTR